MADILIFDSILKSEAGSAERLKRYVLAVVVGLFSGAFFVSATWLLISGAETVIKYVF